MATDPACSFVAPGFEDCFAPAERCWCGWAARIPSVFSPRYHCCTRCGTHYSAQRIRPDSVARFYGFVSYWQERNQLKQHEPFADRSALFARQGRLAKWVEVVERHHHGAPGSICEIGCAEGTFLSALRDRGWTTIGLEPDAATADATRAQTGLDIRAGSFPCPLDVPALDAIVALDVLEHAADPRAFLEAVRKLLKPDGFVFLQSPILGSDPAGFGPLNNRAFDAQEHAFLFTRDSVADLLAAAGFTVVENHDAWGIAHEIVVARPLREIPSGPRPLANLPEMYSPEFAAFAEEIYAFAERNGLATYGRSPRTWELPWIWHNGLSALPWSELHLVDIGSEISPWPWWIATRGAHVTLVEVRRDWEPLWQRLRRDLGVRVDWVFADSDSIPLPSACADIVTTVSVLEHQQDKPLAMAELERILRPGGTLGLTCDIFEAGLGMSYPEWNGAALGAADFEDLLGRHPSLRGVTAASTWNWADVRPFLTWFNRTAPHHDYAMTAAVLTKQPCPPPPIAAVPPAPAVLVAQPGDAAGAWVAARWLQAWAQQQPERQFFWVVPPAEVPRLLALLPQARHLRYDLTAAPRIAARTTRAEARPGLNLLVAPLQPAAGWTDDALHRLLWWRDFLGEFAWELALVPAGAPDWLAAVSAAASRAPRRLGPSLPPEAAALVQHATTTANLPPSVFTEENDGALCVAPAQAAQFAAASHLQLQPSPLPPVAPSSTVLLLAGGPTPTWPQARWLELAELLRAHDVTVELIPPDGITTLAFDRLRAAAAVVCAEGPCAQMAVTVGIPVVIVAGGGEERRWRPDHGRVKFVQGLPACSGCGWNCLLDHPICVEAIPAATVAAALRTLRETGDGSPVELAIPLPTGIVPERLHVLACRQIRQMAGTCTAAQRSVSDAVNQLAGIRHAALALSEENRVLTEQLYRVSEDSQLRLQHIHELEARWSAHEADRETRLQHIHEIEALLTANEKDREIRLQHIHSIESRLAANEADRETRLQHIHAIEARLAASEADREARLQHIHRLEARLLALPEGAAPGRNDNPA